MWNEAQKAAQYGFSELIEKATVEISKFKLKTKITKQNLVKIHQELNETQDKLEIAINRIAEAEIIHAADTRTLAAQEKIT